MNKFQKSLDRIKKNVPLHEDSWTDEDKEHILTVMEAVEKQIAKKPIKKNPICYEKTKDGIEHFAYDYFCLACNKQIKANEHHCECGQALDWSDTE